MLNQKITRNQALALIQAFRTSCGSSLQAVPLEAFKSQLPTYETLPAFVSEGCKVYAKKRGCVITYMLSGYAVDGADVRAALTRIGVSI